MLVKGTVAFGVYIMDVILSLLSPPVSPCIICFFGSHQVQMSGQVYTVNNNKIMNTTSNIKT